MSNQALPQTYDRLFLGVATQARPDWGNYFLEPKATRSSKPESVAKEQAEKRQRQADLAPVTPVSGTVVHGVLLDSQGNVAFEASQRPEQPPGLASFQLITAILGFLGEDLFTPSPRLLDVQVRLFGFFIRDRLKLLALDALHYVRSQNLAYSLPVGLWYHRPFENGHWLDPYEVFIASDMRGDVDYAGLCDFLKIPVPPNLDSPMVQAELARQLALAGQFFPTIPPV